MKFKTKMLDYCKIILEKLSFSRTLFRKEYRKSLRFLTPSERNVFRKWVREKYGDHFFKNTTEDLKFEI
jgi:hypothetical protein